MKNDFYRELPKGYRADKTIDAKSIKFGVLMNVAALVIMVAVYLSTEFISCGRITLIFPIEILWRRSYDFIFFSHREL